MKKVFLDTNFLMDLLVRDDDFRSNAKLVLEECLKFDMEMKISFLSVANFAYIMRKTEMGQLKEQIKLIINLFSVVGNDESHLLNALDIETRDYEDAIQYETALSHDCDCIVTRNQKDFRFSTIPVFTPHEFLCQCR
ncbi:MAG: PIN domain-containing protein [Muribaculaceae bacterium]|nr:PIN domain-containing protein [Muribaculaceae bacterium]